MSNEQTPTASAPSTPTTSTTDARPELPAHAVPDPANPGSHIVAASIAPIHGPTVIRNALRAAAAGGPVPHDPSLAGKGSATGVAVQLITPIFDVPPVTRIVDVNYLRVAACTLDRAQIVALDICSTKGAPDDDAGKAEWQRMRNMAKAYVSDTRDEQQLDEARRCACDVVAMMEQLPLTPMACDAMCLAFATISRGNERRENGHPAL